MRGALVVLGVGDIRLVEKDSHEHPSRSFWVNFFKIMYAAKGVNWILKIKFDSCISFRMDPKVALIAIFKSVT